MIIISKVFIKQPVIKQSPTFPSFFILILIKAFIKSKKLIRIHDQAFIICKDGENLKILMEIFLQKHIVSTIILAFLDHLKPIKIFLSGQPCWPT